MKIDTSGLAREITLRAPSLWTNRYHREHAIVPLKSGPKNSKKAGAHFVLSHRARGLHHIHIGKCGGTSLWYQFLRQGVALPESHMSRPPVRFRGEFFCWVRNPIDRFVSAYNFARSVVEFDDLDRPDDAFTLDTCPAPARAIRKKRTGHSHSPEFESLVRSFESAEHLAQSLSSGNAETRERAEKLMRQPFEHLFKGIGWYLYDGLLVRARRRSLLHVGRLEHFSEDYANFVSKLNTRGFPFEAEMVRMRTNKDRQDKTLSPLAVSNVIAHYQNTDYRALKELNRFGFLPSETLESYYHYKHMG